MKRKKAAKCAERVRAAMRVAPTPELRKAILGRCAQCAACAALVPTPERMPASEMRKARFG